MYSTCTVHVVIRKIVNDVNFYSNIDSCISIHVYIYIYIYIYVHSTLAFRKEKEKEGKVTHPTIAQTNKRIYNI